MKQHRRQVIRELIESRPLRSQSGLVAALRERGIKATQATVSRDLADLGVTRSRVGGVVRYVLPAGNSPGLSLEEVMRAFVLRTAVSGMLIVVHTPPGHAGVVAAAIDEARVAGVLGVVAGDDTLFVCCEERAPINGIMVALHLPPPTPASVR